MTTISAQQTADYLGSGSNFSYFYQPLEFQPELQPTSISETIKFPFTISNNLYIDTQTTHLQFTIRAVAADLKGCNLLLDGSSSSLIEELKIESNANQLELMQYYDLACNQLETIGVSQQSKAHRQYFGYVPECYKTNYLDGQPKPFDAQIYTHTGQIVGSGPVQSSRYQNENSIVAFMPFDLLPKQLPNWQDYATVGQDSFQYFQSPTIYHGAPLGYFNSTVDPSYTSYQLLYDGGQGVAVTNGYIRRPLVNIDATNNNWTLNSGTVYQRWQKGSFKQYASNNNRFIYGGMPQDVRHRVEALDQIMSGNFGIQGPLSYPLVNWTDWTNRVSQYDPGAPTVPLAKTYSRLGQVRPNNINTAGLAADPFETCSYYGYQVFSGELISKGGKCLSISGEHATHLLQDGSTLAGAVNVSYIKILVPLTSAIMGNLNQKYMPGSSIGRMVIHVTLNKHAFFLSGLSNQFDGQKIDSYSKLMQAMVTKSWQIKSVVLKMDTYRYGSVQNSQIQAQLESGPLSNNLSVYLGGAYVVPNTQSLTNNWNITARIAAIRMITAVILSNDYQKYTYCRKNAKLSGNITKIRLRFNEGYLPTDGIKGHAGNVDPKDASGLDNTEFVVWLHKSLSCFTDPEKACQISKQNFAINDRCYPPDIFTYPPTQAGYQASLEGCKHLWYGMTSLYEQNYFGQAMYLWVFGQKPIMPQSNIGLDSRNLDIFQIEITVDSSVPGNTRPQSLIILLYADMIFRVYPRSIVVAGK